MDTYLNWIPIFEWYVARWVSKNMYQKTICVEENGLLVQNLVTIFKFNSKKKILGGGGHL